MKHYRAQDGSIHAFEDDGSQDYLIRPGMVALTAQQLDEARATHVDPAVVAQGQIRALEIAELAPRFVREALLDLARDRAVRAGQVAGLTEQQALVALATRNQGYIKLKALDDQIAVLRAIVRGDA